MRSCRRAKKLRRCTNCTRRLPTADIFAVTDEPDFILDLQSLGARAPRDAVDSHPTDPAAQRIGSSDGANVANRPWVGIQFECCGVYTRIYRSPNAREYRGRCPRCGSEVTLRVGPDGTASRFFSAR